MGWSGPFVLGDGRKVGYAVRATCEENGCKTRIDRGLAYVCGSMHDGDNGDGCGHYFCYKHLLLGSATGAQNCARCYVDEDEPVEVT